MSAPRLTDAERKALAGSLRWHFDCHAAEPEKSFASVGIENAVLIVEGILADRLAAAWDEGYFDRHERGPAADVDRSNPYRTGADS